jgi:ferredoxin-NADP reductase
MATGSFTAKLFAHALASADEKSSSAGADAVGDGSAVEVLVDGPYGRGPAVGDYEHLVLVAGGIGITPIQSVLAELVARKSAGESRCGKIQSVQLVWTARDTAIFELFQETLADLVVAPPDAAGAGAGALAAPFSFDAQLYCTSKKGHYTHRFAVPVLPGRPILSEAVPPHAAEGRTLVIGCGPTPLIDAASELALDRGYAFHHEVFDW